MKLIALAAKLAVLAAVLYGLHLVSLLNQRSVTAWTTQRHEDVGKPVAAGRGVPFAPEQRSATAPPSCADQTWPKITPACITGQAQPVRPAPSAAPVQAASVTTPAAPAADIGEAMPSPEPATAAKRQVADPAHTGSLPAVAHERLGRNAHARKMSSTPRETRRAVRLRDRRYAAPGVRTARWAASPRPPAFFAPRRPSRLAAMPWTNSNQNWRDGRPE